MYGKIYRETNPEEWVMQMESLYGMDIDPSIYLLLLTADPEFLCKNDDGQSFSAEIGKKKSELYQFDIAFDKSRVMNKMRLNVSNGESYLDQDIILDTVNKFLNFK